MPPEGRFSEAEGRTYDGWVVDGASVGETDFKVVG